MTGWMQGAASVVLAVGLHIGFFSLPANQQLAPPQAAGEAGAETISLAAQDVSIAAMVAEWDRPPAVADVVASQPIMPDQPAPVMPDLGMPEMPVVRDMPQMTALLPVPDTLPAPVFPQVEPTLKPKKKPSEKPPEAKPAQAAKPAEPADSRAGQKAAGSGGGATQGDGAKAETAGVSKAQASELKANWGAKVRARIERKKSYPKAADGVSGTVSVRLTVGRGGDLQGVSVAGSSGNAALDAAAVKAVKSAGRFPKAPNGLTDASYSFTLSMAFQK